MSCIRIASANRRWFIGMVAGAVAMPHVARAGSETETLEGRAFGTVWRIVAASGSRLDRLRPAAERILAEVDRQMSPWQPESEIGQFNNAAAITDYAVTPDTAVVVRAALTLAAKSNGRFDPTVGPQVARWGFGPIAGDPTAAWEDITVTDRHLSKAGAGATLDLCGIAKGWALDRLAFMVRTAVPNGALIDLGGELFAIGTHQSGRPWQVAVENPEEGSAGLAGVLGLTDRAVATSGQRAQGYTLNGRSYGHIIDPVTGAPVAGSLLSVSVVAEDAMSADGWATALFAAGSVDGPELARRHEIDALFLARSGADLRSVTTGAMDQYLL